MRKIHCVTCGGSGEVCVGRDSGSHLSPPDPVYDSCPICTGSGVVRHSVIEDFSGGIWPTEYEALGMIHSRNEGSYYE